MADARGDGGTMAQGRPSCSRLDEGRMVADAAPCGVAFGTVVHTCRSPSDKLCYSCMGAGRTS